jgi:hypothetical protein
MTSLKWEERGIKKRRIEGEAFRRKTLAQD